MNHKYNELVPNYRILLVLMTYGLFFIQSGDSIAESTKIKSKDDKSWQRIELKGGSVIIGKVISENKKKLKVKTSDPLIFEIDRDFIRLSKSIFGEIKNKAYHRFDPNYSRLLFAPTGRPLRKGEGYFSSHYVFLPSVAYGITDNISVMAGMSLLPGVGIGDQMKYAAPRVGFKPSNNFAYSFGFLTAGVGSGYFGIAFASQTFGPSDKSISTAIGWGYFKGPESELEFSNTPILMIGGNLRINNYMALVSENWIFTSGEIEAGFWPFSVALRFFGEKIAVDVGFVAMGEILQEGFPIPWLSFTYNIGL